MSRTDLDSATIAKVLRRMAGDGSMEWVHEPMQASVLLDLADMLDENAKLREELESVGTAAYLYGRSDLKAENTKLQKVCKRMHDHIKDSCDVCDEYYCSSWDEDNECCVFDTYMRELGVEVDE